MIDRANGCGERIESRMESIPIKDPQRGEVVVGTDRRDAAAEDDVLEVLPGRHAYLPPMIRSIELPVTSQSSLPARRARRLQRTKEDLARGGRRVGVGAGGD